MTAERVHLNQSCGSTAFTMSRQLARLYPTGVRLLVSSETRGAMGKQLFKARRWVYV